jgi:tetratricopeptide (TPR) repeat protein
VAAELRELAPKAPGGPVAGSQDPIRQRIEVLRSKLEEKDWQAEALIALREAVRLEPSEAKYWYNLGTTLKQYRPSEVNEAADALLRAVELDGTHYPTLRNLALFLQRQGRHREARDICLRMEQVSGPDDPAAVSILGDIALADGDYQEAEQRYKKLLELGIYSLHAHVRLAIVYLRQGDLEKSHEHTEQAVAIEPENEEMIRRSIERSR